MKNYIDVAILYLLKANILVTLKKKPIALKCSLNT